MITYYEKNRQETRKDLINSLEASEDELFKKVGINMIQQTYQVATALTEKSVVYLNRFNPEVELVANLKTFAYSWRMYQYFFNLKPEEKE